MQKKMTLFLPPKSESPQLGSHFHLRWRQFCIFSHPFNPLNQRKNLIIQILFTWYVQRFISHCNVIIELCYRIKNLKITANSNLLNLIYLNCAVSNFSPHSIFFCRISEFNWLNSIKINSTLITLHKNFKQNLLIIFLFVLIF